MTNASSKFLETVFFVFVFFCFLFYIGSITDKNVAIVSGEQQRNSAIHIHGFILPQTSVPHESVSCSVVSDCL